MIILLGYKRLRDVQFSKNDPLALHLFGLTRMHMVSTISCQLRTVDDRSNQGIERTQQSIVIDALTREQLAIITIDFDGSVLGTCHHTDGAASGFNKKKKGQRSYWLFASPLYDTPSRPNATSKNASVGGVYAPVQSTSIKRFH